MINTDNTSSNKFVRADDWVPAMLEIMKTGKELSIHPTGYSMYPFLKSKRDTVIFRLPDREIKRGDIVLYRRENGLYVVHRIHHVDNTGYYLIGDNQDTIEGPLERSQILALAVKLVRKGKEINCRTNYFYRFLAWIWLLIIPIRLTLVKQWNKMHQK